MEKCRPVFEDFKGWESPTRDVTDFAQLPMRAQAYVKKLADLTGIPVGILSVGPRRASTMLLGAGLSRGNSRLR